MSMPPIEVLAPLFPDYELLSLIGQGRTGAVYKARQKSLDRLVAIKVLSLEAAADREFVERFKREAQTMARLKHANLIALYHFGQTTKGHLFIAMEYYEGQTLHELIQARTLTPARVVQIIGQICDGLATAHREGIVHRNIKPANILVCTSGEAKVADFGLARAIKQSPSGGITLAGVVIGTLDYMAPEHRRGEQVDQRSDIYALGVVLYEALTRQVPRGNFAPASQLAGVPKKLDEIIARAMHADPAHRFQSTMEMKAALDALSQQPGSPQRAASPAAKADAPAESNSAKSSQSSGQPAWLWAVGGVVLLGLATIGYVITRPGKTAPSSAPTPLPIAGATPARPSPKAVAVAKPSPAPSAPKPPTKPVTFGASRYQLIRSQASWTQAKTEAEFKGGHLATLTTKEEADWARKTFGPELDHRSARIWIGAYQTDRDDTWHWVTDEDFAFTDWSTGEPNAVKNQKLPPPFCVSLVRSRNEPGATGWDDTPVGGGKDIVGYLVEWDEPKSAPVVMATPAPATPAPVAMTTPAPATPMPAPVASATPPPPTTSAPVASEAEQRLAAIKAQYDAAYARDIGTFDASREMLRTNYQTVIDREIARLTQSARIAEAAALREERARAVSGRGLDSDPSVLPEALRPLRMGYRNGLAKIEADRAARLKPLRDGYLKLLDAAEAEFAKARKSEAALAVKQRRTELTSEWATEPPPVSAVADAKPAAAATSSADSAASSWRKVALFTLRNAGKLDVRVDNKRTSIADESELPTRRFDVVLVQLTDADQNAKLTDADFAALATCRELEVLQIYNAPISSKGLDFLRSLTALHVLKINNCPNVTDAAMPVIGTLSGLTTLELHDDGITKEGIKNLTRCTKLRNLSLTGQKYTAGCVTALAHLPIEELSLNNVTAPATLDLSGFRQLKRVTINGAKDAKAHVLDECARLKGLETLHLNSCGVSDEDFVKFSGLTALKTLDLETNTVRGPGLTNLRSCRALERLRLNNCGATDVALEIVGRELTGLRYLTISGPSQVQGPAFRALGKCRALKEVVVTDGVGDDAVAAELSLLPTVDMLNFSGCPQLSDAGLQSLARTKALKRLYLARCTKLTDAGVAAFKKSRPDVNVER